VVDWMPAIVGVWMAGAVVLAARLTVSWRGVRRLQRGSRVLVAAVWVERVSVKSA